MSTSQNQNEGWYPEDCKTDVERRAWDLGHSPDEHRIMELERQVDTLRGLLRAAQTRLSCTHLFIGYCPECRDLHQRITAALPKEPQ